MAPSLTQLRVRQGSWQRIGGESPPRGRFKHCTRSVLGEPSKELLPHHRRLSVHRRRTKEATSVCNSIGEVDRYLSWHRFLRKPVESREPLPFCGTLRRVRIPRQFRHPLRNHRSRSVRTFFVERLRDDVQCPAAPRPAIAATAAARAVVAMARVEHPTARRGGVADQPYLNFARLLASIIMPMFQRTYNGRTDRSARIRSEIPD
jgi:hypothetical protein